MRAFCCLDSGDLPEASKLKVTVNAATASPSWRWSTPWCAKPCPSLQKLAEQGVPTVTLISDLSNSRRVAVVGLDNRTAAYLIARFMGPLAHSPQSRTARVAMIVGSLRYRAHEEREAGFLHLFEERFPLVQVVGVREGQDDPNATTAKPARCWSNTATWQASTTSAAGRKASAGR